MFGYIIVNKPEMKFREFDVYHGYYCGLCRKLKEHYGKFGQITLSYDMVFVLMTLTSLYELETTKSMKRCVTHPLQKHEERVNKETADRKSTRLNSSHTLASRMPSSA